MAELILFTTRNFLFMKKRNRVFAIDLSFDRLINRKQATNKKPEQATAPTGFITPTGFIALRGFFND